MRHTDFKKILGLDNYKTLDAKRNLASVYQRLKRYDDARKVLQEILTDCRSRIHVDLDPEDIEFELGTTLDKLKRYEEALSIFQDLAEVKAETYGKSSTERLKFLPFIARLLYDLERYKESERFWRRLIDQKPKVDAIRYLARCLEGRGKWKEAAKWHENVYHTRIKVLGEDNASTIQSLEDVNRCRGKERETRFSFFGRRDKTG